MTTKRLNQYPYLDAKIKRIKAEIEKLKGEWAVCGTVLTSNGPGLTQREEIVGGRTTTNEIKYRLVEKENELMAAIAEKSEIERYIRNVADMRIHESMARRYIDADSWAEVAAQLGAGETGETVRKAVERYVKKIL